MKLLDHKQKNVQVFFSTFFSDWLGEPETCTRTSTTVFAERCARIVAEAARRAISVAVARASAPTTKLAV
jgi:hypothetical protein